MERNTHTVRYNMPNHIIERLNLKEFEKYMDRAILDCLYVLSLSDIQYLDSKIKIKVYVPEDSAVDFLLRIDRVVTRIVEQYFL